MADENTIRWYRTPVPREQLQALMQRSDARGFGQVVPQLLLHATTGAVAYYACVRLPVPVAIAACYIHCTFFCFLGMAGVGHELSHNTVFKTRFWNECFMRIVAFLSWTNYILFRATHTRHHMTTVHGELDQEVMLPQKLRTLDWVEAFTVCLTGIWPKLRRTANQSLGRFASPWEAELFADDPKKRRQFANWARVLLFGHAALAGIFIYFKLWPLLWLVTFAPFCASWLNLFCWFPQHAGLPPNVPDFRVCCRTILLNPFTSFLYCQMNHHVEHHMYAAVPFYNLRKLRETMAADLPPAPTGLVATWKQLFPILRRQKTDPDYVCAPALPGNAATPTTQAGTIS